jgi:hypothetical protein
MKEEFLKSLWISVDNQLPPEDEDVLVYMCKFGKLDRVGAHYIGWYNNKKWTITAENGIVEDAESNPDYWYVTHWRSLDIPTQ